MHLGGDKILLRINLRDERCILDHGLGHTVLKERKAWQLGPHPWWLRVPQFWPMALFLPPIAYAQKLPQFAKAVASSWRPRVLVHEPLGTFNIQSTQRNFVSLQMRQQNSDLQLHVASNDKAGIGIPSYLEWCLLTGYSWCGHLKLGPHTGACHWATSLV